MLKVKRVKIMMTWEIQNERYLSVETLLSYDLEMLIIEVFMF